MMLANVTQRRGLGTLGDGGSVGVGPGPWGLGLGYMATPRSRVVRALEIIYTLKNPVPPVSQNKPDFEVLYLGVKKNEKELKILIKKRLLKRLQNNAMINEVKKLHNTPTGGLSWKRLEEFGLEYRAVAQYLQNKITKKEMIANIQKESEQYIKRQMTWFKRNSKINWIKNPAEAEKLIKKFL